MSVSSYLWPSCTARFTKTADELVRMNTAEELINMKELRPSFGMSSCVTNSQSCCFRIRDGSPSRTGAYLEQKPV